MPGLLESQWFLFGLWSLGPIAFLFTCYCLYRDAVGRPLFGYSLRGIRSD